MKLLLLFGVLLMGTAFLVPGQKNIAGTWVLETQEKQCETAVLRIQMTEGHFTGSLDIPDQQVYDRPVSIELRKNKVKILLDDNGSCFLELDIADSSLKGQSHVGNKTRPVKFYRPKI